MKNTEFEESKLNADQTSNVNSGNEVLITTEDIEGTPFTKVYDERMGGHFIAYGNNIIVEPTENEETILAKAEGLKDLPWKTIIAVIGVLIDYKQQNKN